MIYGRAQSPAQTYFYQKDIIATAGKIRLKFGWTMMNYLVGGLDRKNITQKNWYL